jgi:hypothetical protein
VDSIDVIQCFFFYICGGQDKREYEDATAMLREDVKMWQNQVDHLRSIIHSRGSDEIDEISKKYADLVAKVQHSS